MLPESSTFALPPASLTARRISLGCMLSSMIQSTFRLDRLAHLAKVPALDLDLEALAPPRPHPAHRGFDRSGEVDMVVLDEHHVEEPHAVVPAPPTRTAYFASSR